MKSNSTEGRIGRAIGRSELGSPQRKRRYNENLFAVVAPRYDLVTRFLSFGRDQWWKQRLVKLTPRRSVSTVMDLACGTGDITLLLQNRFPEATVTGLDLTEGMLTRARRRPTSGDRTPRFVQGDMNELPLPDGTADVISGGYALRNAPDLAQTLHEIHRVLRPRGTAHFLEFSAPQQPLLRGLEYRILRFWGQLWGVILHGDAEVYAYIARSLRAFPDAPDLEEIARQTGFEVLHSPFLMAGMMRILRLRKRSGES